MITLQNAETKRSGSVEKYIMCPHCGHKNKHIWKTDGAKADGFYTICKKCKKEFEIK